MIVSIMRDKCLISKNIKANCENYSVYLRVCRRIRLATPAVALELQAKKYRLLKTIGTMKNIAIAIIPLLFVAITISCTSSGVRDRLLHAESLMDRNSDPDSALSILQSIDPAKLRSGKDKALYALLYTQALDKNQQVIRSDSLISFAVEFFTADGDDKRAMVANYYHGRVRYMNDEHTLGIVSFFHANEIANEIGDAFWAGMSCRGISDIYNGAYNAADELVYAKKSMKTSARRVYSHILIMPYLTLRGRTVVCAIMMRRSDCAGSLPTRQRFMATRTLTMGPGSW